MPEERKRTCLNCCYYDKDWKECRRSDPPWYEVALNEWCGEYKSNADNVD
jgi:hypothetical protein